VQQSLTTVNRAICKARYAARTRLPEWPALYLPYARARYGRVPNRLVRPDTEIVIEGFPRSGNTFAVCAFELAQERPVRSAHHLHASAQVREAVRLGVPVMLLVREPEDSAVSQILREPCISPRQALGAWIRFYRRVAPLRDRVFVADFARVSTDFGAVIRDFNSRFGTVYKEFDHTPENEARCFALIEQQSRRRFGDLQERRVARPSEERLARKAEVAARLNDPALRPLREGAGRLHRALVPAGEAA